MYGVIYHIAIKDYKVSSKSNPISIQLSKYAHSSKTSYTFLLCSPNEPDYDQNNVHEDADHYDQKIMMSMILLACINYK